MSAHGARAAWSGWGVRPVAADGDRHGHEPSSKSFAQRCRRRALTCIRRPGAGGRGRPGVRPRKPPVGLFKLTTKSLLWRGLATNGPASWGCPPPVSTVLLVGRARLERVRVDPDALRAARLTAGYSQSQLARRMGVAEGHTVSGWERGRSGPLPAMIPRLAKVLGVRPEALLTLPQGGPTLHWLRLRAGLSIGAVAERASMSKTTYRRLELGEFIRLPDDGVIAALAGAMGVSATAVRGALRGTADLAKAKAKPSSPSPPPTPPLSDVVATGPGADARDPRDVHGADVPGAGTDPGR